MIALLEMVLAYAGTEEPPLSWCAKLVILAVVLCLLVMVLVAVWPHPGPASRDLLDRYPEDNSGPET